MKSFWGKKLVEQRKNQRKAGFTLVELLVVMGLLSLMAFLVYPAYLGISRSYSLTDVKSSLQQNARLAMKRMVTSIEAGMVVIPKESDEATDGSENNYGYDESKPYKIVFYTWNNTPGNLDNDKTALYAALPTLDIEPVNPALTWEGDEPLLYMRRYDVASSSWEENPLPLVRPEVRITQLNFILGGDNQDKVLVTLELAQEDSTVGWRTYKLVSAAKLGAR
jgi:prepilin-type N-terminal cleavage/methylation domain-containing protein